LDGSPFSREGDGPYSIFSKFSIFFLDSLDLMEDRMALGIHRNKIIRIPTPADPKRATMREVSNFHMRNLSVRREADEFWIAKTAIPTAISNTNQ
jgi:hypothetical protein